MAARLQLLLLAVLLCACASTAPDKDRRAERAEPDMKSAARINTELGLNYARNGEFDLALDKLTRAIEQDPSYAMAHTGIAYLYAQRKETDLAEQHYKRALRLNPGDPGTRNNFAVFLCGQGRAKEADKLFVQAATTPRYEEPEKAYTNAGVCARRSGDLERADAHFRKALQLKPNSAEALQQMASLCLARKDYLRGRAFLQRYEKVGPATPATLWIAAKIEFALGNEAAAAAYTQRLKKDFPDSEESSNVSSDAAQPAS